MQRIADNLVLATVSLIYSVAVMCLKLRHN
jgi:hypothetical protein